jgi:protein TonB
MSAAVNDRPHDLLSSRPHLPLTGEFHPLRREFERLLATGNVIALTTTMLAFTVVYFWPREAKMEPFIDMESPVVINERYVTEPNEPPGAPGYTAVPDVPKYFIPEPVEKIDPKDIPLQIEPGPPDGDPGDAGNPFEAPTGPPSVINIPPSEPEPSEDYVYFDSEPVMLSCDAPVYPDIVRDAGIDGTVNVRVLVGSDGKVKHARVVEGPQVLREAALASARTAIFKPALAKGHPVEVWVVIPVVFRLHATD